MKNGLCYEANVWIFLDQASLDIFKFKLATSFNYQPPLLKHVTFHNLT